MPMVRIIYFTPSKIILSNILALEMDLLQRYQTADLQAVQALEDSLRTAESYRVASLWYSLTLATIQQDPQATDRARLNAEESFLEHQKVLLDTVSIITRVRGIFQECLQEAMHDDRIKHFSPAFQ